MRTCSVFVFRLQPYREGRRRYAHPSPCTGARDLLVFFIPVFLLKCTHGFSARDLVRQFLLVVSMSRCKMNLQDASNQFINQFAEYGCRTLPTCSLASVIFQYLKFLKCEKNEFGCHINGLLHYKNADCVCARLGDCVRVLCLHDARQRTVGVEFSIEIHGLIDKVLVGINYIVLTRLG